MLTREQHETLTRVGPQTPMGRAMRRYWVPAALSSELPRPDSAPIRVRLLGEKLVAFRDSAGRVGLLEEFCAHRGASLFLGRNEESGLRCVYHGWKYDVEGKCVDMPTEPAGSSFPEKIRLVAYPTQEIGGVIWAYMGPPEKLPPPPRFEWTLLPDTHRVMAKVWEECNWLQAIEGGLDSFHASLLHGAVNPDTSHAAIKGSRTTPVPGRDDVEVTDYGFMFASLRDVPDGRVWVRIQQYVMPFHTFFPYELLGEPTEGEEEYQPLINGHIFVPMDNENTMTFNWFGRRGDQALTEDEAAMIERFRGRGPGETTGDFRKIRNKDNDWLIDREVQRRETYSGIEGIHTQDHAIQESMGAIVDHSKEHLGNIDLPIIRARKLLLDAAKAEEAGRDPRGVGLSYENVRSIERIMLRNDGERWRETLKHLYQPGSLIG